MKRKQNSHKGDNGKVLVIGGNAHFHGAPILCALGAEHSGVDLVFPMLPPCHAQVARTYSLNFIVHYFAETHLTNVDVLPILDMSEKVDVVVIGPGLGKEKETQKAVKTILHKLQKPTVIDADALIYTNTLPKDAILTPHHGEFKELTGDEPTDQNVQKWARNLNATIVCKGPEDIIADQDQIIINKTGTPFMTVGGSGDVLSGIIGGLIAQGYETIDACRAATYLIGKAGETLAEHEHAVKAHTLAKMIPRMLHDYFKDLKIKD